MEKLDVTQFFKRKETIPRHKVDYNKLRRRRKKNFKSTEDIPETEKPQIRASISKDMNGPACCTDQATTKEGD